MVRSESGPGPDPQVTTAGDEIQAARARLRDQAEDVGRNLGAEGEAHRHKAEGAGLTPEDTRRAADDLGPRAVRVVSETEAATREDGRRQGMS